MITEENLVKKNLAKKNINDLTETYIRNFDSLKHTFTSAPKKSFFTDIEVKI